LKALVIGGSLGGLFAANLLHDLGWDVEVFEKVGDDLAARGAGIGTHKELVAVLAGLGISLSEDLGAAVGDRICVDKEGRLVHRAPWAHVMSAWANVYRPLKDRFPAEHYHFGKGLVSFAETKDFVVANFEDGSTATGDLLIGADGLRSTVRMQLFPEAQPRYGGYVAWRGLVEESLLSPASREKLSDHYWFVLPKGEMALCYLVPRLGMPGRKDWNWVWYDPTTEAELADLCTDATGRNHGIGIPPPLIRPDVTDRIKHNARTMLPPHMAEVITAGQPFFQSIFDVESPRMAVGRVCLLGDAAFVARPHVGMGVTKGALDAVCLANSLKKESSLEKALDRYSSLRTEFGKRVVARARRLGAFVEAVSYPERPWTREQLDQSPERLLREVAASLSDIPELQLEI
jgi:2-polyprenyl-6-methoxyphenol hydroxylase-like FAD-dependent oxidoreductase